MFHRHFRVLTFLALAAALLFLGSYNPIHAAIDAVADYRFNNSLASSAGTAPALVNIGTNSYVSDDVMGATCTVLEYPSGSGLQLATNGLVASDTYSLVMLLRLDAMSGYKKFADFSNGVQDYGLYFLSGNLRYYPVAQGPTPVAAYTFVQVVLTRDGTSDQVTGYVNGVQEFQFNDNSDYAVISAANTLRFLLDDELTSSEETGGAVARIRLYDSVLNSTAVQNLDTTHSECNNTTTETIQDSSPWVTYNGWNGIADGGASGGTFRMTNSEQDKAIIKFSGTSATVHYRTGSSFGKVDLYIDKVKVKSLCLYSETPEAKHKKIKKLANKKHKFELRVTSQTCNGGSQVGGSLDKLVAGETTLEDTATKWMWNGWRTKSNPAANGGMYRASNASNAFAQYSFVGTEVTLLTLKGPAFGDILVVMDGTTLENLDLFNNSVVPYSKKYDGLADEQHMIELVRNASSGTFPIVIDGFRVPVVP